MSQQRISNLPRAMQMKILAPTDEVHHLHTIPSESAVPPKPVARLRYEKSGNRPGE